MTLQTTTTQPTRGRLARRGLVAALALGVAVALAACSSPAADAGSTAAAGETRTVTTPEGDVTVPSDPQRIVSVHSWSTETLFDLGVTPVGVEDGGEQYVPPRYLDRWKPIDKVAQGGTIDFEKLAALQPDVIVGVDVPYLSADYEKLSAIAPTVLAPFDDDSSWQDYPAFTADAVNRTAQLDELKADYAAAVDEVRSTYADAIASTRWDIIQGGFDAGNYWIYGTGSPIGTVLTDIGSTFADATTNAPGSESQSVSYEQAGLLQDADAIVYYTNNDGSPANDIDQLFALQAYQSLPAVVAGNTVGTSDFLLGSYADANGALDSIVEVLKKRSA
jgi:iron complex transport system substrate-binding protein